MRPFGSIPSPHPVLSLVVIGAGITTSYPISWDSNQIIGDFVLTLPFFAYTSFHITSNSIVMVAANVRFGKK